MQSGGDHDDDADFEAANWLIVLSEEPVSEDVRVAFEAWLADSSDHVRAWALAQETYGLIGHAPRLQPPVEVLPRLRAARDRRWPVQSRRRPSRVVLAGALAASLALFIAPPLWLHLSADGTTGVAEVAAMTLPDGSRIEMGPSTTVKVRYSGSERRIELLAGEASFDVRRNPRKPFIVEAGDVTTSVLGTAFEVRRERTGTFVAVAHGRVRVEESKATVDLLAGDWVRLGDRIEQGIAAASQNPPERRMVIVKDRPVSEVIDRLRPWFSGVILVGGRNGNRLRVTGAYDPTDPARALALLLSAHGGRVHAIGPWFLWISLGES